MEIALGIINKPLIFVHQTGKFEYEVEVVQQKELQYEFNYLINCANVEFVIGDRINSWATPVKFCQFSFFDISTSSTNGEASFELSGFNVTIRLLNSEDVYQSEIEVFDFEAYLNQINDTGEIS